MNSPIESQPARRLRHQQWRDEDDCLVVEEPLEIRLDGRRYTATMRTPGQDELLVRGLLFAEGVVEENDDIEAIQLGTRCRESSNSNELVNVADVTLHDASRIAAHLWERSLISNASCGLCGKASVEAFSAALQPLPDGASTSAQTLLALPRQMLEHQALFKQTGGLHAASLFESNGTWLATFEDIGRHNATDKLVGWGLERGVLPCRSETLILLVSGRASFEIVQKSLRARVPVLSSVSAVSSLAVQLSAANNQTLIGFLRDGGFSIYAGAERIEP